MSRPQSTIDRIIKDRSPDPETIAADRDSAEGQLHLAMLRGGFNTNSNRYRNLRGGGRVVSIPTTGTEPIPIIVPWHINTKTADGLAAAMAYGFETNQMQGATGLITGEHIVIRHKFSGKGKIEIRAKSAELRGVAGTVTAKVGALSATSKSGANPHLILAGDRTLVNLGGYHGTLDGPVAYGSNLGNASITTRGARGQDANVRTERLTLNRNSFGGLTAATAANAQSKAAYLGFSTSRDHSYFGIPTLSSITQAIGGSTLVSSATRVANKLSERAANYVRDVGREGFANRRVRNPDGPQFA